MSVTGHQLVTRSLTAELELISRGHGEKLSRHAVKMAREWAIAYAERCRPEIQDQVASDLFESRLREVERDWLPGQEEFLGRIPPRNGVKR